MRACMMRELFNVGPLAISPFGVLMVIAFLAAWAQLRWGLKQFGAGDDEDASAMLLAGGIGGIVGAKIYYSILYGDWRYLFDRAGLVWYGAFILGTVAVLWVIWKRRMPVWPTVDATAPAVALGYGIGRIGCFLVGDDFGQPTDLPWGVAFPYGLPAPTTAGFMRDEYGAELPLDIPADQLVAVHPTQLYETAAALGIWAITLWLLRRGSRSGIPALVCLGLLAVERFGVEFLRAKDDRIFGHFTVAQLLSVAVLLLCGTLLWRRRHAASE